MKAAATFLLFLTLAVPPPLVNSQPLISSSLSSTVTHVAVSANGVFVSTANQVHHFSPTLQQSEGSPDTPGGTVTGMASTPDGEWCVVCTDAGGETCSVLNGSNLEAPANRTVTKSGIAISLAVFTGGDGNSFYTGSFVNSHILYHQYGFAGSTLSRATNPVHQQTSGFNRVFVSGFFASGYAYYLVSDPSTSGVNRRLRIIRVCNDSTADGFNNQYELTLGCDGNNGFFNPTLIDVFVINGKTLFIAIRFGSVVDVCSYSLPEINSLMDAAYQSCVVDGNGNKNIFWQNSVSCSVGLSGSICSISDSRSGTPAPAVGASNPLTPTGLITNTTILNGLTAIVGVSIDDTNFIYFALTLNSNNYCINKYHLVNSTTLKFISQVTSTSTVTSLSWSQGSEYVYGISGTNVIALKTEGCSSATSCSECVSLGDPLCGWCMIENKCSRKPFCQDNDQTGRYLTQGDSSYCFDALSIDPSTYVIDIEQQPHQIDLTFLPAPPPSKLPGEEYFCVFNGIMSPLELSMGTNAGSCSVQDIVSQVTGMQLDTTFSIYSNRTGVNFYTRPTSYTFYSCPTASKCSACLQSETCGWCQLDFTCTGQNSSCTTGEWFNIKDGGSASSFCPFLEPNSVTFDGRYTQAANVTKNLTLSTSNTGSSPGLTYECVYGTDTRTATVSHDNKVTCNNNPVLTIGGGGSTQNVSLSLRQVYNENRYTIETNATANLNVILYDCPTLALGCSSCLAQRIDTGFSCSWCNSNNQCRDISDCNDASAVISTGNCPLPMITDFNPKAGPPRGGTTIIINGTNLGTQRSDIESVIIGTRNCIVDEYEPGVWITCTIDPDTSDTADRNETIMIRVTRSSGSVSVNSTTQYQFITPIIQSVSPTYGPVSGGTRIRVQGTNFDIGNKKMTRVIMRQSSSRKKRNTCPDVNCNITNITNTEINCITSSIDDTDCVRNVIVSVNGASFSNTSISYQYRPDPTFDSISPMIIIPAGGIQLVFTGANLNSVQSPTITINDSRLISSSVEPCVTNDNTTLICNAPNITNVADSSYGTSIEYMLMLDGAESPNYMNAALRLKLQRNPIFTGIDADSRSISVDDINDITIRGMNVESVNPSEINIMLGDNSDDVCSIRTSSKTEITCRPPNKPSGTTLALRVRVGRNLVFPSNGITGPEWTLEYANTSTESITSTGSTSTIITTITTTTGPTSTSTSAPSSTSIGAIVGGSIAASIIITLLIVAIPLIIVIFILQKRAKDSKEKPISHRGNLAIPISMNIYQGITSQDNNLFPQSNPAYIKASDIHEIPASKNEEFLFVKKANNEDNEGHVDTGVIDDIAQSSEDKGSYENISKVDGDAN
ncbi:PREDICTED: plexin-A1-like [Amphimedon queenslandica]|uniref:Sema domain-containing protein n=1 Tax=Amphimedon queenslandica TaxID=400682 RepID=A0AAN0IMF8_AMPQE|nr:PREDICTED: plexin-A1-like [Amphimedon queenslandica]|eukprot:XP_011404133.1 PREDICTED: plexin-A1-like [Amphimedon queenslandica]